MVDADAQFQVQVERTTLNIKYPICILGYGISPGITRTASMRMLIMPINKIEFGR